MIVTVQPGLAEADGDWEEHWASNALALGLAVRSRVELQEEDGYFHSAYVYPHTTPDLLSLTPP